MLLGAGSCVAGYRVSLNSHDDTAQYCRAALYFAYADNHMCCRLCHCGLGSRKDLEHVAVLLSGPRHLTRAVSPKQTMCDRRTRCQRLLEERDSLQVQQVHILLLVSTGYCAHAVRGCLSARSCSGTLLFTARKTWPKMAACDNARSNPPVLCSGSRNLGFASSYSLHWVWANVWPVASMLGCSTA